MTHPTRTPVAHRGSDRTRSEERRLVIAGAGPVGLHAGLRALQDGYDVTILEQGTIAQAVRQWQTVTLFTPFHMNSTAAGRQAAAAAGADLPSPDSLLIGSDYIDRYLQPLADGPLLADRIRTHTRLAAAARCGCGKSDLPGRPERGRLPFRLLTETPAGEDVLECDLLLDCTGFVTRQRPIGPGGIPCPGERSCLKAEDYRIAEVPRRPPRGRILVVGSGYSAATSACRLRAGGAAVTWITRPGSTPVPIVPEDPLSERSRLTREAADLVFRGDPDVQWLPGYEIHAIRKSHEGFQVTLAGPGEHTSVRTFERVVANAGSRPDAAPFQELQIHRCYATEGTMPLAARLLGQTTGDCLAVEASGADLLRHPEPGFFTLGAASYGRDSRFLLHHGLSQIDCLFDSLQTSGPSAVVQDLNA